MKSVILTIVLLSTSSVFAAQTPSPKSYVFQYKTHQNKNFTITSTANSQQEAFRIAAKECFNKLTGNKYPGEEKGLEIIDICANPKI